ncbi:MAG TPA: TIGR01777 family oxidoreductase [Candidatus Omnitrophota bacterium]|nr:TIGR01777 family oxidoreductase [Candidatus Omnitrophota bacterium]
MKIAITGSAGLIGSYLCSYFQNKDIPLLRIRRGGACAGARPGDVIWSPAEGRLDAGALDGAGAVIHLAGANLAARRWDDAYKREILESRVRSTRLLVETFRKMPAPPKVFLSASALGFYGGHRIEEFCDESSPAGTGFLADVCRAWEEEAFAARRLGIRTVALRFGAVLSRNGGMLAKLLPVFRTGLGGCLGSGKQPLSWISLLEVPRVIEHILEHDELDGPVNCSSPYPVSSAELSAQLGLALRRPAFLPVPAFALKAVLGPMAQEVILQGVSALPARLLRSGYRFSYPDLSSALSAALGPKTK